MQAGIGEVTTQPISYSGETGPVVTYYRRDAERRYKGCFFWGPRLKSKEARALFGCVEDLDMDEKIPCVNIDLEFIAEVGSRLIRIDMPDGQRMMLDVGPREKG